MKRVHRLLLPYFYFFYLNLSENYSHLQRQYSDKLFLQIYLIKTKKKDCIKNARDNTMIHIPDHYFTVPAFSQRMKADSIIYICQWKKNSLNRWNLHIVTLLTKLDSNPCSPGRNCVPIDNSIIWFWNEWLVPYTAQTSVKWCIWKYLKDKKIWHKHLINLNLFK